MNSRLHSGQIFKRKLFLGLLLIAASGQQAHAGVVADIEHEIRLSQWLTTNNASLPQDSLSLTKPAYAETQYLPGLVWMVPEEARIQSEFKTKLLEQITRDQIAHDVSRVDAKGLADFVASLNVTGRVVVEKTDSRWLEVNPLHDPLLKKGQRVLIPARPTSVTVVKGDGSTCQVAHSVSLYALDYAKRCDPAGSMQMAWVVQPDGLVQRAGLSIWNENSQNTPAPGAWIVLVDPATHWPDEIYEQVARLLATQGVSNDASQILPAPVMKKEFITGLSSRPRGLTFSSNLIQTPTARMGNAGEAALNVNHVWPYTDYNADIQPFDWLKLSFGYSDFANKLYGPASFSGNQTYKDKSFDVKVKLSDETAFLPQLAIGGTDMLGTALRAGEFVVASKRTASLDWTLGLGWGYLGARGNMGNPLATLSSSFSTRPPAVVGQGGTVQSSGMFRGPTALFGGVQYQTPWDPLLLKLEYEGNNYQHEPFGNNLKQTSPVNVGMVYRLNPGVDLALSFERGNTVGMGFSLHGDLSKFSVPKLSDPVSEPVVAVYPEQEPDWNKVSAMLEEKTSWHVLQLRRSGSEVIVRFQNADATNWNGYVDRIVSVLHKYVPGKNILVFRIQSEGQGLALHEFQIDRHSWVAAHTSYIPPHHNQATVFEKPAFGGYVLQKSDVLIDKSPVKFSSNMGMYLDHSFGGPEGLLYRVGLGARGNWNFRSDTWWTGSLQYGLIDNYNKFIYPASNSTLPRVRTQIQRYVNTSPVTMPVFQFTHVNKLNDTNFVSVYGGMLENMYGGVGGEWLYRPWHSPVAVGIDINSVQQRGFSQDFSFLPYKIVTGHASLYWETGFQDINATVHAGKYLAGDTGATLDLSRSFTNGVKMGAFATKTNVSAVQFGEGSFDKGVYLNIPFDALLTRSSVNMASITWHPLTRDGGAMLNREFHLFDMTRAQSGDLLKLSPWSDERKSQFGEVGDTFTSYSPGKSVYAAAKSDLLNAGRLTTTMQFWESMLWMGGITLASSVVDKPADRLAVKYGAGPTMKGVESFGNMLPFAALGASGMAFLNAEPEGKLATTAYSSLAAGGIGLLSTLGMKYVIGRDRPLAGTGPSNFNFVNANNGNASMPSGHTTIMWAAITPYAKEYNAPWLYGLAALTNVARIGGRNHWFSDTVAGSLFGYAIGDFVHESHHHSEKRGMNLQLAPNGVTAYWKID